MIRRNDRFGRGSSSGTQRPRDPYRGDQTFRFVPDVNCLKSYEISRICIDLDRPKAVPWKAYSAFVNEFIDKFEEKGFRPWLRLTGGPESM